MDARVRETQWKTAGKSVKSVWLVDRIRVRQAPISLSVILSVSISVLEDDARRGCSERTVCGS